MKKMVGKKKTEVHGGLGWTHLLLHVFVVQRLNTLITTHSLYYYYTNLSFY